MRVQHLLLCFLTLLYLANAARSTVEHRSQKPIPHGWEAKQTADPSVVIPFTLVLRLKNDLLEKKFWSVSDPSSPDYANYLKIREIADQFGPSEEDIAVIKKVLLSYKITNIEVSLSRDFISFSAPVSVAEDLFEVTFLEFEHNTLPTVIRSLDPYTLPSEIARLVSFVSGIHRFPSKSKLRVKQARVKTPISAYQPNKRPSFDQITPQAIWQAFNTNGVQGSAKNNLQGVAQFLDQFFDPNDLAAFESAYSLPSQPAASIVGPNDPTNPGTEASLDIQYIIGTAPLIPTWFWSTGPPLHGGQEDFVRFAQNMNSAATVPFVMSVSYGDDENTIDKGWADRLNLEFQKLALRGVSVLFASGDDGVGCTSACRHLPGWPASSPFVTAVGGFVGTSSGGFIGDGISSGGFSDFYARPSYQDTAVTNYLKNGPSLPPPNQYNATSRGIPDVSSFSENVMVYQGGAVFPVGGTSCASPVFSAVISLINDALLSAGKRPLGFLNPALYKIQQTNPSAFIDITTGNNGNGCCNGFTATKGWDPITGLGAPNFPVLKQSFMAFQNAQ